MSLGDRARGVGVATLVLAIGLAGVAGWFAALRFAGAGAGEAQGVEKVAIATRGWIVAPAPPALAEAAVRNVILLLGDGMGVAQIIAGRTHSRGPDGRLQLERLPVLGLVATHPEGALIAKSDATATALATGRRTANGRVGSDAAGRPLPTIVEALRDAGWATGLVTTSRITDATPAAFAAHVAERRMQPEIAEQLARSRVDLLIGGGRPYFVPASAAGSARRDELDLVAEARAAGIRVIETPAEIVGADALPLFVLLDVEPQRAKEKSPTIAELAARAIALLSASGRPFFLLVEEEEIDSAAHRNDIERMSAALERFDTAVAHAVEFAAADGRTLVLVTGDHGTGGPTISQRSTADRLAVAWESGDHTGEPMPLFAYGPPAAAALFAGFYDNTDVPARIGAALGFDFPAPANAPATEVAR